MINGLDHFALGVEELDERIQLFTEVMGLKLMRRGTRVSTGKGIAFLTDATTGFKVELIETEEAERGLVHLAFHVDDIDSAYDALVSRGLASLSGPHYISAAKADSALLEDETGLKIQLISYDPDSPDLL